MAAGEPFLVIFPHRGELYKKVALYQKRHNTHFLSYCYKKHFYVIQGLSCRKNRC